MNTLQKTVIGTALAVAVGAGLFLTLSGSAKVTNARATPGLAAFSGIPASRDFSFGPVVERMIRRDEADAQGFVFLCLKDGKVIQPAWSLVERKGRGVSFPEFTPELRRWIQTNDADVLLHLEDDVWSLVTLDTVQAPAFSSPLEQLDQLALQCIASDVSYLERELGQVTQGNAGAGALFVLRASYGDETDLCELVHTRRGELLVWNWTSQQSPRSVKLRYRLVRAAATNFTFEPVIERMLDSATEPQPMSAEDLDLGRAIDIPAEVAKAGEKKMFAWLATNGADLLVFDHKRYWDLWISSRLTPVMPLAWERPTKASLLAALAGLNAGYAELPRAKSKTREGFISYRLNADELVRISCAFQTSTGGLGLLQFIGIPNDMRSLKIRYKLARPVHLAAADR